MGHQSSKRDICKSSSAENRLSFTSEFDQLYCIQLDTNKNPIILGNGGFSSILLANGTGDQFEKQYAIKYINLAFLEEKIKEGELNNEKVQLNLTHTRRGLQVLLNFSGHPNIIKLFNVFDSEKMQRSLVTVMERADGGDLYDHITKSTTLSELETKIILKQIASGIVFMHEVGSVHRDIKCENIIQVRGTWKICDFGFARDLNDDNDGMCATLCGTKGYAAPEVFLGKPYFGKYVDVYSLGVVTFMCLCGYLPFKDGGIDVVYHPERWKFISALSKDFITSLLKFDPISRLKSKDLLQHDFFK
jgi:calcium/calmodulin-dependent protein kinase I